MEDTFKVTPHAYSVSSVHRMVILDLRQDTFIGLNKSATAMWVLLSQEMSFQNIVSSLATSYAVHEQRVIIDLCAFIQEMKGKNLIEPLLPAILPPFAPSPSFAYPAIISPRLALQIVHEQIILPGGFLRFAQHIHALSVTKFALADDPDVISLSHAIRSAASSVPFRAACLHQSIALCWMLRLRGIDAHMVIGVYLFPFSAHVWVESEEQILQWEAGMGPYPDAKKLQAMSIIFHSGRMHTNERKVAQ